MNNRFGTIFSMLAYIGAMTGLTYAAYESQNLTMPWMYVPIAQVPFKVIFTEVFWLITFPLMALVIFRK